MASKRTRTITNIAQALSCVAKMKAGRPCTVAEMRATALLLDQALKTAKQNTKMLKDQNAFLERLLNSRGGLGGL